MALATGILAVVALSGPLYAAQRPDNKPEQQKTMLKEVIVTAQKRAQSIQDVPITMTALSASSMKLNADIGFRQWSATVPGLQISQGTSANRRAGPTATILGVSQNGAGQLYEVSAMATTNYTFGEVPIDSVDPALFDLNRIEVLQGPQGALFGLGSMGGTIRYIPNDANPDSFAGEFEAGAGLIEHGGPEDNLELMVNVPLIKHVLAIRFAGETVHQDGYITVHKLPLSDNSPKSIQPAGGTTFTPPPVAQGDIPNANASSLQAARVSITYKPTKNLEFRTFGMTQTQTQATTQTINYNSPGLTASLFALQPMYSKFRVFSFDAAYHTKIGTLHYILGRQYRSQQEQLDFSTEMPYLLSSAKIFALQVNPNLPEDPLPSPTVFPFFSENRIASNELRLQGTDEPLFGSVTFDYTVGLFQMTEKAGGEWQIANTTWNADRGPNTAPILTAGGLDLGQDGGGNYSNKSAFGNVTLHVTRKLSIGGGARYSKVSFSDALYTYGDLISGLAVNGATVGQDLTKPTPAASHAATHDTSVTPRAVISYRFDPNVMVYLNGAEGQRFPESLPNPHAWDTATAECVAIAKKQGLYEPALNGAKSDTIWTYQLGLKSAWLDHRLILNPSLFDVRWTGIQLNVLMNNFAAACNSIVNANVGDVQIKGVEFSGQYAPLHNLVLEGTFTYAHSALQGDVKGVESSVGTPLTKGDLLTDGPTWQANASAQYTFPVPYLDTHGLSGADGFLYANWTYVGKRFDSVIGNQRALEAQLPFFVARTYSLTNLRLGIRTGRWSGAVYCNNVFDKRAMLSSYAVSWMPNLQLVEVAQPRTIGLNMTVYF